MNQPSHPRHALHFATQSYPRFGRGIYSDDKPPQTVKDSPFFWWFMFLRLNNDYLETEQKDGVGPCSDLYKDFGNVTATDFKSWWREHSHLFAEEKTQYRLQVARSPNELAPFNSDEAINVVVPLSWSQKSLKKHFSLLLNKYVAKGERGPKLGSETAKYSLGRRWNANAMETAYNVYRLRQKHLERGAKKTAKTQHKGDESAKYKIAWADIAQMANVIVSDKDAQGIERGRDETRRLLTILANRHFKRALDFIKSSATNNFPLNE
jgi:hypothetical protein